MRQSNQGSSKWRHILTASHVGLRMDQPVKERISKIFRDTFCQFFRIPPFMWHFLNHCFYYLKTHALNCDMNKIRQYLLKPNLVAVKQALLAYKSIKKLCMENQESLFWHLFYLFCSSTPTISRIIWMALKKFCFFLQ